MGLLTLTGPRTDKGRRGSMAAALSTTGLATCIAACTMLACKSSQVDLGNHANANAAAGGSSGGGSTSADAGKADAAKADAASNTTTKIDRSGLLDVGIDKDLDYSDPRLWLCRPGNDPDECDINMDATELLPDGSRRLVKHVKAKDPEVDCFYVYPTVKLTSAGPMTDFANIDITLDPLLAQAARFNQVCQVYAPLYRQTGVVPGAGGAPTPSSGPMLGLGDIQGAFKYYLEHLNKGRKFVLMGHSQGTGTVTAMMKTDVDPKPEIRSQMISALLIGGGVTVPENADVGATFQNIPLCTKPRQLGCVVAYNSFSKETPPSASSTFAHASAGQKVACTEPAALADRAGLRYQGSYVSLKRVNPSFVQDGFDKLPSDVTTRYILYRDVFRGACKNENGASYLEISLELGKDEQRPPPPYHSAAIEAALGLHLVDYNLELDDLIEMVRLQIEAARN
jgi:hypothetical protein